MIGHFPIRRGCSLLLALLLMGSLVACGERESGSLEENLQTCQQQNTADDTVSHENVLIAYFSLWDNAPWVRTPAVTPPPVLW